MWNTYALLLLFTDERNFLQEQRFVSNACKPEDYKGSGVKRGGGKRRPLLAGHATATLSYWKGISFRQGMKSYCWRQWAYYGPDHFTFLINRGIFFICLSLRRMHIAETRTVIRNDAKECSTQFCFYSKKCFILFLTVNVQSLSERNFISS